MSLPIFPEVSPPISRDDAINYILASIALEELGLSHILNAEGEKIQFAVGTLPGVTGPNATIEEVIEVNQNVLAILDSAAQNQVILNSKLRNALSASTLQGPTGPTGPTGPSGGPTGPTGPTGATSSEL